MEHERIKRMTGGPDKSQVAVSFLRSSGRTNVERQLDPLGLRAQLLLVGGPYGPL